MIRSTNCLKAAVIAASIGFFPMGVVAAGQQPSEPVAALDDGLIQAMQAGSAGKSFQERCDILTPAVKRAYNLPAVLRRVIGLRFDKMSQDQQQDLLDSFTKFTVATYVANFNKYDNQHFDITGTREAGADQIVGTNLVDHSGEKVKLDYVVESVNGYYQVIDVLLDGSISRSAVMRSDFRSLLSSGGPDALIKHLEQKTSDLSHGRG